MVTLKVKFNASSKILYFCSVGSLKNTGKYIQAKERIRQTKGKKAKIDQKTENRLDLKIRKIQKLGNYMQIYFREKTKVSKKTIDKSDKLKIVIENKHYWFWLVDCI